MMNEVRERKTNWFAILIFLFLLAVIGGGGYFLFFAPTPGIEIIAPPSLQETEAISEAAFDPGPIVNDPVLKTFREYGTTPSVGNLGRSDPFSPY